jgi:hypothetical protein
MKIRETMLRAKAKFDSLDRITECFILPNSWKNEVSMIDDVEKEGSQLMLWGAFIFFGDVVEPIIGTTV